MSAGEAIETPPPAVGPEPSVVEDGPRPEERAQLEERRRDAYRVG